MREMGTVSLAAAPLIPLATLKMKRRKLLVLKSAQDCLKKTLAIGTISAMWAWDASKATSGLSRELARLSEKMTYLAIWTKIAISTTTAGISQLKTLPQLPLRRSVFKCTLKTKVKCLVTSNLMSSSNTTSKKICSTEDTANPAWLSSMKQPAP